MSITINNKKYLKEGGPNSGNFGHAGRPGQQGGSGPGGGGGATNYHKGSNKWGKIITPGKGGSRPVDLTQKKFVKQMQKMATFELASEQGSLHSQLKAHKEIGYKDPYKKETVMRIKMLNKEFEKRENAAWKRDQARIYAKPKAIPGVKISDTGTGVKAQFFPPKSWRKRG